MPKGGTKSSNGGERLSQGVPPKSELMALLERQGFVCALTGSRLTPENATVDHKIPKSNGGLDCLDNLHWVCKDVNKAKGAMSMEDFVSMCCLVARKQAAQASEPSTGGHSGPGTSPPAFAVCEQRKPSAA